MNYQYAISIGVPKYLLSWIYSCFNYLIIIYEIFTIN